MHMTAKRWMVAAITAGLAVGLAPHASAVEFKEFQSKKYGYAMKIPAQFIMDGKEDNTTTWIYQPGAAPAAAAPAAGDEGGEKKGKKKKLGAALGGLVKSEASSAAPSAPAASGGGAQPALSIYVNWTWMPDVDSGTMYSANKKGDKQKVDSPDPDYKDIKDFDKKQGYAYEGNTYWLKEVDKDKGDDIHRWHIHSFGNKSAYVVGLCGTYDQFKEWAPIYEEVIKSWKLIPLEK